MKKTKLHLTVASALLILAAVAGYNQEREDRTLLNWDQMRAIINEASGDRAMHHILELVPYPRVRTRAEYEGHFRESEVMARFAREYGFSNVEIESFEAGQPNWQAWQGELWEVKPDLAKICDIHDVAISLMSNSETGDVTAEVIDVGSGSRAEDYEGKDVKGKIVLGSGNGALLQRGHQLQRHVSGGLRRRRRIVEHQNQCSAQRVESEGRLRLGSLSPYRS
jgi:aminopeptidase YwaD